MAVYTELTDKALADLLTAYDIGDAVSCEAIAEGVENSNYFLQTQKDRYIVTIYEKRVKASELPFFLALMTYLAGAGIPCPVPIARRDGKLLSQIANRPAAIISFLDGKSIRRPTPQHCYALGEALAQFHLASQNFTQSRANSLSIFGWQKLFEECRAQADELHPALATDISKELERVTKSWPQNLPQGIIHGDLFVDNVFFMGDKISCIIDFYFACNDALVYDLAIVLNAWCFEADVNFNITKARAIFDGYHAIRPLEQSEIDALPVLASGAALRFLLTRLFDWLNHIDGAFVQPKDPIDYLRRLRFHKNATHARDYGVGL